MNGAWILPTNEIVYTNSVLNHEYQLISNNINKYIFKDIIFSDDEYKQCLNKDIRYQAFKSGFIRIITIYNQIAIECLPQLLTKNNIILILTIVEKYMINVEIKDIVLEDAYTHKSIFFQTLFELKNYLENTISGQYIK